MRLEDKDKVVLFNNTNLYKTCEHLCCSNKYRHDKQDVIFVKKNNN